MKITNLKDKDLNALDGLCMQFWGESSDIHKMAEMFQRLSKDKDYVLLAAKQNDVLVGFCMGVVCQSLYGDCSPFMVIEDFIVDEQCRRTGIGITIDEKRYYCLGQVSEGILTVSFTYRSNKIRIFGAGSLSASSAFRCARICCRKIHSQRLRFLFTARHSHDPGFEFFICWFSTHGMGHCGLP